ncbi:hypothetical protein [Paenibacillus sp. Cedars]|uniref:hypothetical protein n=1 Tax=Paenibacillus sp. Cedars TaxID=1980674 RepID=UPI001163836C|nr:hypothetical protein [Paenibacillus sp. Cedars]AWP28732.1 hypothetical protein B9D94_19805 [Paenibacillus sp. Cedars]
MNNRVKLIEALRKIQEQASLGNFSGNPDNVALRLNNVLKIADEALTIPTIKPGDGVRHVIFGTGIVIDVYKEQAIVDFDEELLQVNVANLEVVE